MKDLFRDHPSPYMQDFDVANDIKEKLGRVAEDYSASLSSSSHEKYELPDGQVC
jgi:hypothetical protein